MKIVVTHGDDTDTSYKRFSKILDGVRKKGWEIKEIDSKDDIKNHLINTSLFDENILYTVKNAEKIDKDSLVWIRQNHTKFDSQLLMYSTKKLPVTFKKNLPDSTKYELFEKPVLLWKFLDSIYPGNYKSCLKLFIEASQVETPELLISLMGGLFRDMYIVQCGEELSYPDWRTKKIISQAQKFTKKEIVNIVAELGEIDYKSKTSDVEADLLVELFLFNNLK